MLIDEATARKHIRDYLRIKCESLNIKETGAHILSSDGNFVELCLYENPVDSACPLNLQTVSTMIMLVDMDTEDAVMTLSKIKEGSVVEHTPLSSQTPKSGVVTEIRRMVVVHKGTETRYVEDTSATIEWADQVLEKFCNYTDCRNEVILKYHRVKDSTNTSVWGDAYEYRYVEQNALKKTINQCVFSVTESDTETRAWSSKCDTVVHTGVGLGQDFFWIHKLAEDRPFF